MLMMILIYEVYLHKLLKRCHLECLKCAHIKECPWDEYICSNAPVHGQLECLNYAHENNYLWHDNTCYNAACNGFMECLNYAHENGCE